MNGVLKRLEFKFHGRALILAGIVVLALALRFIYIYQIETTPLFDFLAADTGDFERFALKIIGGDFFYRETLYFNPLYPFFLAFIYLIFGHHLVAVGIIQALLDSVTCLLVYFISVKTFRDQVAGLLGSFLYAGYGLMIFYTGIMIGSTLATFLFVSSACLLLLAKEKKRGLPWFLAGVTYGIGCLLRPNVLFILPFLIFWIAAGAEKGDKFTGKLSRLAFILAGILLIILPFSLRNYVITGHFSLPFGNGGFNFYVGNHPGAEGTYTYLRGISNSPAGQIKSSVIQARRELGSEVGLPQASAYWFRRGIDFIKDYPFEYLVLLGRKFLLFWNAREIGQNIDYNFSRRFAPLLRLPLFSFGVVAPFAWLGFVLALRGKRPGITLPVLFVFAYMGSVIFFFVSARYRLPAVPFIIIFAAYGVCGFVRLFFPVASLNKRKVALFSFLLLAAFVVVNLNLSPFDEKRYLSWSHNMLGNVYQEKGMTSAAIEEFRKAISIDPDSTTAYNFLGSAYWKEGRFQEAMDEYRRALRVNPADPTAHNNLGVAYAEQGMVEEAFREFQDALRANPDFGEAHSNLAVYYLYYGNDIRMSIYHCDKAIGDGYEVPEKLRKDLEPYYKGGL